MKKLVCALALTFVLHALAAPARAVSAFDLPWMNAGSPGATYKSTDHRNGIFVVEAYYLDCYWCNYNAPNVEALAEKYKDEPRVQVLDVGTDRSDSQYAQWIATHHPNHPVLKDGARKLIGQLGTQAYPSTYVLDCKGNVITSTLGAWGPSERQQLQNAIDQLLTADCSAQR